MLSRTPLKLCNIQSTLFEHMGRMPRVPRKLSKYLLVFRFCIAQSTYDLRNELADSYEITDTDTKGHCHQITVTRILPLVVQRKWVRGIAEAE